MRSLELNRLISSPARTLQTTSAEQNVVPGEVNHQTHQSVDVQSYPSGPIAEEHEQQLVSGAVRRLYFEQVRIYRNSY